jgi:hypothetical protein
LRVAKAKNTFEEMAKVAAVRLRKMHDAGEQLTFLPDERGSVVDVVEDKAPGRPKGSKGKVNNQMRDWLAAKGYAMPEDVLAQMAGLANGGDAMMAALERTELVLAWAYDGATTKVKGGGTKPATPSGGQRLAVFMQIYTIQLRAADALMPYGAPKATPDVNVQQSVYVNVPSAPAAGQPGDNARVVSGSRSGRMVPADVAYETEQKQDVSDAGKSKSDKGSRTE